jgi:hypothetical protein
VYSEPPLPSLWWVEEAGVRAHRSARREGLPLSGQADHELRDVQVASCGGETTTPAGHNKTCTHSVAPGKWYAASDVWFGSEYIDFYATQPYRFGQTG